MSTHPSWQLWAAYRRGLEQVFALFKAPDPAARALVAASLLVRDSTTLLSGLYGAGKTQLVQLVVKTFFTGRDDGAADYGFVACTQDLTPMDTLFSIDLARLVQGEEVVRPRRIVTSRFKFVNEAQRASSLVYNALLPLLAEKLVAYRDQVFRSPSFVCFLDANPHDAGSSEVPNAFLDRVDFSLHLRLTGAAGMDEVLARVCADGGARWGSLADLAEPVLGPDEMESAWTDVRRVAVGREVRLLATLVAGHLQRCAHVDRSTVAPDFDLPCAQCSYRGSLCAKLVSIPGHRFLISSLKLAQARAWLRRAPEVAVDDLLWTLPFTLAHRLRLRSDSLRLYPNPSEWLVEEAYRRSIRPRVPRWRQAIHLLGQTGGVAGELRDALADRDLALADLLEGRPPTEHLEVSDG